MLQHLQKGARRVVVERCSIPPSAMADEPTTIAVCTVISGGFCGDLPWIPNPSLLENIEGRQFIRLCKADFGFRRFVGVKTFNKLFYMDSLRGLRSKASLAISSAEGGLFDELPSVRAKKRQRHDAAVAMEQGAAPATVQLQLPALTAPDGTEVAAMVMVVKFCAQAAPAVVVELTPAALTYVKYAMLSSEQEAPPRARKSVVHWRESRMRYIANRTDEASGVGVQKSFKPTDASATAMAACREAAELWVQVGEDVEISNSGDDS
jgi:hypothetical protein